jgi:hypothetical protein
MDVPSKPDGEENRKEYTTSSEAGDRAPNLTTKKQRVSLRLTLILAWSLFGPLSYGFMAAIIGVGISFLLERARHAC